MGIKTKVKNIIKTFMMKKGLKTDRHIVVFESDDWGAVRNSSKENLNIFSTEYPDIKLDNYQSLDILETDEDILKLKSVLQRHKDSKGEVAKFTLNFATANPDFDKIKQSEYKLFVTEKISDSYRATKNSKRVLELVKEGIQEKCFMPQLHTREHLNGNFLLADIVTNSIVKRAFDLGIIGVVNDTYAGMDSLNVKSSENNKQLLTEAVRNFEEIFGFVPKTYIAPCYVWSEKDELVLKNLGIKALQGKMFQNIPLARNSYQKKFHAFGSVSKTTGLQYFSRNCFFEPSKSRMEGLSDKQMLENILKDIDTAFKCKKPAVICTHRVNYVSGISLENRESNLKLLDELLSIIVKKYPNIEFLTSSDLVGGI